MFYGVGSPYAGHSLVYRPESVPIAAIVLLEQSSENQLTQAGIRAVPRLVSQIFVNSWDVGFMDRISSLVHELLMSVPVYILRCTPDSCAVEMVRKEIFG